MSEYLLKAYVVISDHGLACFLEVSEFFCMMLSTRRKVHHLCYWQTEPDAAVVSR